MKLIDKDGAEANWENAILKDLSFIKQKLRYPFSSKTIAPSLIIAFGLTLGLWLTWSTLVANSNKGMTFFVLGLVIITITSSVVKFIRVLRFRIVDSPFFLNENINALRHFFRSQQLAFSQHPSAPEVFSIISRAIGSSGDKREVMFFIADEKRILINSHFTDQKFTLTPPSGHSRQMAKRLQKWLATYNAPVDSAITPFNSN